VWKKRRSLFFAVSILFVFGLGALLWWVRPPDDRLFQGKPESVWIKNLAYNDDEQVKVWRKFGPDGVRVLMRALQRADHPGDRIYRRIYRHPLPLIGRWMPTPRMDLTRSSRMTVVSLLAQLGSDATIATSTMIRELEDESPEVRGIAITFFTRGEDENAPLNKMSKAEKRKLLPILATDLKYADWGLRNNVIVALRYYPEEAETVVPLLTKALQDPAPQVRDLAGRTLKQLDPAAAAKAGVK